VDLRGKCSPIENQGDLGACTGHAIVGALEYLENLENEHFTRLSRLFVYYNERMLEGTTKEDAGAQIADGVRVIARYGVCREHLWPYDVKKFKVRPTEDCYVDALNHVALEFKDVDQTEEALTYCLANRRPIIFGIMVYSSFESDEVAATGVVPIPQEGEECLGGHAVLMVGYDKAKRMFLVRNSWGTDWGDQGYFWLPFDFVLDPNLADSFYTVERLS
jgi:C1A family cysteine protease